MESAHIVLGASAAGSLRQALRLAGRKERVFGGFPDALSYGPINPPAPATRVRWMVDQLGFRREDWTWLLRAVSNFWRRLPPPGMRRIVWTSSRSANEYAAFLAFNARTFCVEPRAADVVQRGISCRRELFPFQAGTAAIGPRQAAA